MMCLFGGEGFVTTLIERNQWSTNGTEIDHAFDFFVGFLVGCLIQGWGWRLSSFQLHVCPRFAFEASASIFDQGGPSWNIWMILAPMARLNIPKTGNRWRVAFWAPSLSSGSRPMTGQPTLKGNQWEINPYSCWLNQPLWNICSSNWIISPKIGVNINNIWVATTQDPESRPAIFWAISWLFQWRRLFFGATLVVVESGGNLFGCWTLMKLNLVPLLNLVGLFEKLMV